MARCVHCAEPLMKDEGVCPLCGGEQPLAWLTNLVYILVFLFVQGSIYRLIWPNSTSLIRYGVYFILTVIALVAALWIWKRLRLGPFAAPSDHNKSDSN